MWPFFAKKFDLQVTFDYTPGAEELVFLEDFFTAVSKALFDATNTRNQLGKIFLCPPGVGTNQADVRICSAITVIENGVVVPGEQTHSTGRRYWRRRKGPLLYARNNLPRVGLFVHELGHYLYDLRDEYIGYSGSSSVCTDPATVTHECIAAADRAVEHACLMDHLDGTIETGWENLVTASSRSLYTELDFLLRGHYGLAPVLTPNASAGYGSGIIRQFCWTGNHVRSTAHRQNVCHPVPGTTPVNGECCWETMVDPNSHGRLDYDLSLPTERPFVPWLRWTFHRRVEVVDILPTERFELVLDCSGSMAGGKLAGLQFGADFWIDHVRETEQLGLIRFASTAEEIKEISTVPLASEGSQSTWRNERKDLVWSLAAGGSTAIGDALRLALDAIKAEETRAASQMVLLFSDGLQNFGVEEAESVQMDLTAAGVRLFVIGTGDDQNATLLEDLADETGGLYLAVGSNADSTTAQAAIQERLILAAQEARNEIEIVAMSSAGSGAPDPMGWGQPPEDGVLVKPDSIEAPLWISAGSTRGTIGAFAPLDLSALEFRLFDPDGVEVVEGRPGARHVPWRRGHVFWDMKNPRAGRWRLVTLRPVPDRASLKVFGFETNPAVSVEVDLPRRRLDPGERVTVRVRLLAPRPVRATRVRARFAGSDKTFEFKLSGDLDKFGDLAAAYEAEFVVPDERGAKLLLIDVLRKEGERDAVYPIERVCSEDDQPLGDRPQGTVRVGRIVRRVVRTLIVGRPPVGAMAMRRGLRADESWVPRKQAERVAEWLRDFSSR